MTPLVGSDFRISGSGATFDDQSPALAWNGTAGEYLVVWQDGRDFSEEGVDIYARRVSAAGAPVGDAFLISRAGSTSFCGSSAVTWNGTTDDYLVAGGDEHGDICGRLVPAAGLPVGDAFLISDLDVTMGEGGPAVAWNGTANEYLVVWQDAQHADPLLGYLRAAGIGVRVPPGK